MSVTKAEIKAGAVHEIGCRLDDQLEAAARQIGHFAGSVSGCVSASKKIGALTLAIQRDLDAGALAMPETPIELAKMLTHQIKRATAIADAEAQAFSNRRIQQEGIAAGLRLAIGTTKQIHDAAAAKASQGPEVAAAAEDARDARREAKAARRKPAKKPAKKSAKKKPAKKTAKKRGRA